MFWVTYKDEYGKALTDYPRPSVAVDTAVLTIDDGELNVLLIQNDDGEWRLPGTFLHPGERLAEAVLRSLRDKASITGRTPRQLSVFDDPDRDPRGWVLSVAHVDIVPAEQLPQMSDGGSIRLVPVSSVLPQPAVDDASVVELPFDHPQIIERAVAWMRTEYGEHPDPGGLLTRPFTLRQLRDIHQIVAGEPLMRDTFRRYMEPRLVHTGEMSDGGRGRPSRLFVRP